MTLVGRIARTLIRRDHRGRSGKIDELDRHAAEMEKLDRYAADRAALAKSRVRSPLRPPLDEVIKQAWEAGQHMDLSDIGYGPAHWEGGDRFVTAPTEYYCFLAGLVRSQGYRRIFEIGTHYGGSTLAMLRGVDDPAEAKIVTVDITDLNPSLKSEQSIDRIVGDANTEYIVRKSITYFDEEPIDLMFIDADHQFQPTITNFCLYGMLLRPRMVVLDDIVLNHSMIAMWNVLCATYGAEAVNCVDIIPEIRISGSGFGLVRLR
jgi:hypothetical protein